MKWLFGIFSLLVVMVVGLAVAPSFFDWNQYKGPALKQVAVLTGYDVQVEGDVSLALLPSPRVYLEKVRVADPTDAQGQKTLAAFDQLDVRVGLLPLFKGQAVVNSVHLEKPVVKLFKDAQGQFNFMTSELALMMAAKDGVSRESGEPKEGSQFSLSFESVSVVEGAFSYREAGQALATQLTDINLDVRASSLQGPFKAEGSLSYNDQPVRFEAKTGAIDMALMATSLNLKAEMEGLKLQYAGSVIGGEAPEVQGEASVDITSLSTLMKQDASKGRLSGGISAQGLLTATPEQVSFKDARLRLAGKTLNGAVEAGLNPISVKGAFSGQDIIDLDDFLGSGEKQTGGAFDPLSIGEMLPKTLETPVLGDVTLALSVPGVIVNAQVLKDIQVKVQNTSKSFAAVLDVGSVPGQGRAQVTSALSYAEKSRSQKTQKDIYSNPTAVFEIKGETQNLPLTLQAFTGQANLPLVKDSKRGVFAFDGKVSPSRLSLDKGLINIDDMAFDVTGIWSRQKNNPRSLLKAKLVASALDFDALTGGSDQPTTGDPLASLKTLSFPYDIDADITVNEAVLQGYDIKGLQLAARIVPNNLQISKVAADNFVGASISAKGGISDLKNLSGVDVQGSLSTSDPYSFAKAFQIETQSWPQNLGAMSVDVDANGSFQALDIDAAVKALGAQVGLKGKVSDPMANLSLSGLGVSVQHPDMSKALQTFAPGALNFTSLGKPFDFKADLVLNENVFTLDNIKANLAGASTSGSLRFDNSGSKPIVMGILRIGDLVLKSGSSASSAGQGSKKASGGKWSSAPMDTGWLHAMNANIDVAANSIVYETWDLSKPSLKMSLQNGVLNISELQAGLYNGRITSTGAISSGGSSAPMSVKMNADITNVDMGALAKSLAGSDRLKAEGNVSFDFTVSGKGSSQAALVGSLQGEANLSGQNVVIHGFDLAAVTNAVANDNRESILAGIQSFNSGSTSFETVAGRYAIEQGVVNIQSMTMTGAVSDITSTGYASLPKWTMDTQHTVSFNQTDKLDPFTFVIRGPIDQPANTFGNIGEDLLRAQAGKFVQDALQKHLGDTGVGEALQQFGILRPAAPANTEPASGENGQPVQGTQSQQQQTPEEAIGGLIRGLLQ